MEARVSETTSDRAMVFMHEPQDVEIFRGGHWVLGCMLGWRHEAGSSCWAMVRVTEGGLVQTAWADLEDVRLPELRSPSELGPPTVSLALAAERRAGSELSGARGRAADRGTAGAPAEPVRPRRRRADRRADLASTRSAEVSDAVGRHGLHEGAGRSRQASDRYAAPLRSEFMTGRAEATSRSARTSSVSRTGVAPVGELTRPLTLTDAVPHGGPS